MGNRLSRPKQEPTRKRPGELLQVGSRGWATVCGTTSLRKNAGGLGREVTWRGRTDQPWQVTKTQWRGTMAVRVGINGFGRMGRLALRAAWDWPDIEFAHINEIKGGPEAAAYLLKFDSVHGQWAPNVV